MTAADPSRSRVGVGGRLRHAVARPTARVLAGSLVGQFLVLAASPLITRLYGPADLGALAVVTALSTIVGAVAPLGWDRAIVVPRAEGAARAVVLLAVVSVVAVSSVAAVVAWTGRHLWASVTDTSLLVDAWWVCPVTVLVVALQRVVTSSLARSRRYTALGWRNVLQGAGQVTCNVVLAPLGGPTGLVLGLAAGRAAALVGTAGRTRAARRHGDTSRPRRLASGRLVKAVAFRYRRFPLVSTWSSLLNVLGQQAPLLLLSALHGSPAIGALALTMRVLGAPVGMVADAVGLQIDGQTGAVVRRHEATAGASVRRILLPLGALAGIGLVVCVIAAPVVFPAVFGRAWSGASTMTIVMAPAFAAQVVASPLSRLLPLLERQGAQLGWDVGRLVVTSGAIVASGLTGAGLTTSVIAWSAASVVSYGALLLLVLRAVRDADGATADRGSR
ncbi:oligosaccharide flippase family protein [Frigoribacterium sp. ACAM 257]|uniref:lipopolysaccharide biosynthesis protein n=1 Tax=Frigoribacterium sp. ACAM 257 TaxID=2508998 RepID=UPI0011BA3917|nr:oligosaccharide flippase family protein [Frigoribacterium sp. ACAM 257]TWX34020.1 oligosaccharide flippase family protein [Frigoribacterium sp. ACAM 257]